jgi:hypothetical protein
LYGRETRSLTLKGRMCLKHLLGPYTANVQSYVNYLYTLSPQLEVNFKNLGVIKLFTQFLLEFMETVCSSPCR